MQLLMILAILPAFLLLVYIKKLDRIDKEPTDLLIKLFAFGALTTVSAIILELLGDFILRMFFTQNALPYKLISNFIVVALAEESGKYYVLNKITKNHYAFNYTFDAVVYAVTVSLGFATLENILYVLVGGIGTALLRAVMSVPGHAIFGVFMGYYYGISKMKHRKKIGVLLVPVLLHGFYDFCLNMNHPAFFVAFLMFEIIITIVAARKVRVLSDEDTPLEDSFY